MTRLLQTLGLTVAVAITLIASPVRADAIVSGLTAKEIVELLDAAGFNAENRGGRGGPVIVGEANGIRFILRAFGCDRDQRCDQLMFFANFNLGRPIEKADYELINSYNDSKLFGRGYVLDEDQAIGVDFTVNLRGGVTETHVAQSVGLWVEVLNDFASKIRGAPLSS